MYLLFIKYYIQNSLNSLFHHERNIISFSKQLFYLYMIIIIYDIF